MWLFGLRRALNVRDERTAKAAGWTQGIWYGNGLVGNLLIIYDLSIALSRRLHPTRPAGFVSFTVRQSGPSFKQALPVARLREWETGASATRSKTAIP